ncbi:MAG: hypothetical protein ACXVPU_05605 [Bacteroidia bacterium]
MERRIKFFILLFVIATVIIYINNRIENYDMRFYNGKDDGIVVILESTILLSSLFFSIMTRQNWAKNVFIGLLVGLIASIISYFAIMPFANDNYFGLTFHITSCIAFMTTFFIREKTSIGKPGSKEN